MPISIQLPWTRQNPPPKVDISKIELPKVHLAAATGDAKRAVTEGADQIANVAADVSREAAKIGREAAKMGRQAARKAGAFAQTGETTLRTLRSDAKATVDDLRSVRIIKQRGPDWRPGFALFAGIGAGIAAMFFLDPEQGRRRRVLLADQLRKWLRLSSEWMDGTARDLRNRSVGLAHEARKAVGGATETIAEASEQATDESVAASTPDVAGDLQATDQAATAEYVEPAYVGDRTH